VSHYTPDPQEPLKRLLGDEELETATLRGSPGDLLSGDRARRAVHHLIEVLRLSERFACCILGQPPLDAPPAATTPADPDA